MGTSTKHSKQKRKWSLQTVFLGLMSLIGLPASLFISAGRWNWREGWLYVAIALLGAVAGRLLVVIKSPDLAAERVGTAPTGEVKKWDRWLMPYSAVVGPLLVFVVAGLDERFQWRPDLPARLICPGIFLLLLGIAFSTWAMLANRFFSTSVRIQGERGHHVISGGPYRIVRHPGYISQIIAYLAMPLILGSPWALIPAGAGILALGLRTYLEDKMLQEELPGYRGYAQRVKYRLIPPIW